MQNQYIGIIMDDTPALVTGLLGIEASGNCMVPINPSFPSRRIHFIIYDCSISVLLTDCFNYKKVRQIADDNSSIRHIIRIDHENPENVEIFSFNRNRRQALKVKEPGPHQPVYLVYTSGSTGLPKGVIITQGNLAPLLLWAQERFKFDTHTRVMQNLSYTFDFGLFEIFTTLLYGGRLYLLNKKEICDFTMVVDFINERGINTIHTTPAFFNRIAATGKKMASLETVHLGGERLTVQLVRNLRELVAVNCNIYNGYGPTETTINSLIFSLRASESQSRYLEGKVDLPIGKPSASNMIYIFDSHQRLQPLEVAGELCIAGGGLSPGYLNRPQLTNEKFIDNPFMPGHKLYKTGDLTRWLADGNVEFLGRLDHQVKLRGFRIELGEIEDCLLKHKDIKEAVVITRTDANDDNHLCAYIVQDQKPLLPELRKSLANHLPEYMIPSYFVFLEQMPLSPNGKINRKALPEPGFSAGTGYTAPRNEIEKKLVEIWSGILARDASHASQLRESLGIDANFFELGGHSLKATLMTAKIHQQMNVKIPLAEVFRTRTIKELAAYITGLRPGTFSPVDLVEEKEYYPLSSAQRRVYFQEQMETSDLSYHMFSVVELEGNPDRQKFQQTLTRLISRHDSLRTSFVIPDGEPVQRVHKEVMFQVDYFEMNEEEAMQQIEALIKPFDIGRAPLFKVGLIKVGAEKYLLMVNMHHIISDGFSYSLFLREFMALYGGEPLPGLRLRYKDFSEWQRQRIASGEIESQERFWLDQFQTRVQPLRMPTDYPGTGPGSLKGDRLEVEINREISAKVKQLAVETDTTLFMLLLAVYNVLLSTYTRQKDIVVGTPVSARTHPGLMPLIGMLVNMVALRNFPHQQKTFRAFLAEVKNNALEGFENQDYPFEELIMKLGTQRSAGGNPLFSTVFALDNIDAPTAEIFASELPGLKVKPCNYENKISHFDLVLHANETRDTLRLTLEYSTELYKKSSAGKLLERYVEILEQVVEDEHIKIQDIKISHGLLMSETNVPRDSDTNFGF